MISPPKSSIWTIDAIVGNSKEFSSGFVHKEGHTSQTGLQGINPNLTQWHAKVKTQKFDCRVCGNRTLNSEMIN